jgi:hypothetical protein
MGKMLRDDSPEGLSKILATVREVQTDEQYGSYPDPQIFRIIPTLYDERIINQSLDEI